MDGISVWYGNQNSGELGECSDPTISRSASFTGNNCSNWRGHINGINYAIQGNILLSEDILLGIEEGFLNTSGSLDQKLMAALQGAKVPGADTRCLDEGISTFSAFIRVAKSVDENDYYMDLNVNSVIPYYNDNGIWDDAEPFRDDNGDGKWNSPEPIMDNNGNGTWDDSEVFTDINGNGKWDMAEDFSVEVAPARTFCFLSEVEMLKENGLIKGGSLDNAVVLIDKLLDRSEINRLRNLFGIEENIITGANGILNGKFSICIKIMKCHKKAKIQLFL